MDWKSSRIDALLELALVEDKAAGDTTTSLAIDPDLRASASIIARQELVVAGLGAVPRFLEIFARLDRRPQAQTRFEVVSHPEIFDGVKAREGQVLAVIRHNAQVLLSCERVILNLMQHLSGIATLTRKYVDAIHGTRARVLDTRKTMPGLRALEKYAVLCGGGTNHRLDLASGILIKNNHIALGGGMHAVLARALDLRKKGQRVEVEVRNAQELEEALQFGAEAILLVNMKPAEVKRSVGRIKHVTGGQATRGDTATGQAERWIPTEATGGIVLENIRSYAETGVDFISVGALTTSAKAADISMSISVE
jgi:nicotinate-nucleotide pyrophosphorylase (carboxylating)